MIFRRTPFDHKVERIEVWWREGIIWRLFWQRIAMMMEEVGE